MKIEVHKCRNILHPVPVLAWTIMLCQGMLPWKKESWSHMAMSILFPSGERHFFDVSGEGCIRHTEASFLKKYRIVETHSLKQSRTFREFHEWFRLMEGRKYDKRQIVGLLLKVLGLFSFNKFGSNYRKLICSELVLNYLQFFYKFKVKDSDNFDLIMTWDKAKEY